MVASDEGSPEAESGRIDGYGLNRKMDILGSGYQRALLKIEKGER